MKKIFVGLILLAAVFLIASNALAVDSAVDQAIKGLDSAAAPAGLKTGESGLEVIVGRLLSSLIAFLGVAMLILAVYGGLSWMTAGGDTGAVAKAKQIIINGVIGLAICLLAYSFSMYVVSRIGSAVLGAE